MLVPNFIDQSPLTTSKRNLMKLFEVDVSRDLMDIKIIRRNSETEVALNFFLVLLEWTERQMIINVNFTDPTLIS